MISYFSNFVNYLFNFNKDEADSDEAKEDFLAEQLLELEIEAEKEDNTEQQNIEGESKEANCFKKSGLITYLGENYVLIDGMIYYDTSSCSLRLNVNDKVMYLGYKDSNESIIVVRILENQGMYWGDETDLKEEHNFDIIEHILVGQVSFRQDRFVYVSENDMKFSLDEVEGTFVPIEGDWLEMKCIIQQDNDKLSNITSNQVVRVISFKPLRTIVKSSAITEWNGNHGTCDRQIYFSNDFLSTTIQPNIGSKVMVEAIESNQGTWNWRALNIEILENSNRAHIIAEPINEEQNSLDLEKEKLIEMTHPIKFDNLDIDEKDSLNLILINNSKITYILNKWIILSKKRDSQINIKPFITSPVKLAPGQTITFTVTCSPKFFGQSVEPLIFLFRGFQFKRLIEMNIVDKWKVDKITAHARNGLTRFEKIENMKQIRLDTSTIVPGVKTCRSPNFIANKIGQFPIPEKIWNVVLGDSNETIYSNDFGNIILRIETKLPFLGQQLNITNYTDIWHTLVHMEEIQANLNMRIHDRNKIFLIQHQEYLGVEIQGLAEKRPSLIKGDKVIVKDIWKTTVPHYEGYIHLIKGNLVLMKFSPQFHETYGGSDVSIEFHLSRGVYRKSHHAINLAVSNLGPDILFPSRLLVKGTQVPNEKLQNVKWYNDKLNEDQKRAITNILRGECRPMPYVIFGPPGTGKTVTVIETILQILTFMPESRILVATPSNSASNLLTERLLQYKDLNLGSIIRIIAHYLVDSDNIPDIIKPFCATIDISSEFSSKSQHTIKDNINLQCQKTFIGRHRVTIGTCFSLGTLKHWDLPRGHFTHIIVDEAGQATEPEIMLPLTFIYKEQGQIILAGDPKQLGPVVMSRYCAEYGMDVSYLCRILERFPYQKDNAFTHKYDSRLITKLNENYRSLEEVLTLPSSMFYDGSLNANYFKSFPSVEKYLKATSNVFQLPDNNDGCGIFVYGIKGCNARAEDSPSWFNPQEASMVALTVCKLFKNDITTDEIGIITPYIAQIRYLGLLFDSLGLPRPKIGSVEEFQGQERPIIIISTVRSNEALVDTDIKHSLGFLKNPKRLNVAITRAQVSVILFCNPHLLSKDFLWNQVISYAVKNEKYTGCDLPYEYSNAESLKISDS